VARLLKLLQSPDRDSITHPCLPTVVVDDTL
jgi:hypothetical protein